MGPMRSHSYDCCRHGVSVPHGTQASPHLSVAAERCTQSWPAPSTPRDWRPPPFHVAPVAFQNHRIPAIALSGDSAGSPGFGARGTARSEEYSDAPCRHPTPTSQVVARAEILPASRAVVPQLSAPQLGRPQWRYGREEVDELL